MSGGVLVSQAERRQSNTHTQTHTNPHAHTKSARASLCRSGECGASEQIMLSVCLPLRDAALQQTLESKMKSAFGLSCSL